MSREIAGYRILEELGRGAEGVVYRAESPGVGKPVALKVFPPEQEARYERALETYRALERVRQESGALAHLAEGIAAGALPEGGGFLALAYQASGSLADRVRSEGPLAPEVALGLTSEVLRGLEALHGAGLCHRDVKPQNVLLDAEGRAVLGDFGLVSERDATISSGGTPAFAAPEQWSVDHSRPSPLASGPADAGGAAPERRSGIAIDVYGAGATCYYLLCGRSPVPGAPDLFLLESRRVPRAIQAVLLKALAPRAAERHSSAEELRRDLESALQPPPARAGVDLRAPLVVGLLGVLAAAALWAGSLGAGSPGAPGAPGAGSPGAGSPGAGPGAPATARAAPSASPRATSRASGTAPAGGPIRPVGTPGARAAASPGSALERARLDPERGEITLGSGPERTLLARYAAPPLLVTELSDGRFACSGVAEEGQPPVLDLVGRGGQRALRVALESFPERLLPLPEGALAWATSEGGVWVLDPRREERPRELTRFPHAVLELELRQGKIWVRGDARELRPLGTKEAPGPGEELIEGVLRRYAFPLEPQPEERSLSWE